MHLCCSSSNSCFVFWRCMYQIWKNLLWWSSRFLIFLLKWRNSSNHFLSLIFKVMACALGCSFMFLICPWYSSFGSSCFACLPCFVHGCPYKFKWLHFIAFTFFISCFLLVFVAFRCFLSCFVLVFSRIKISFQTIVSVCPKHGSVSETP